MADVALNLIDPLEKRFSWGDKAPDQIGLIKRDLVDAFRQYSVDELSATARQIIVHRRYSTMPTVGDIKLTMDGILRERRAAEATQKAKGGVLKPTGDFMASLASEVAGAQDWAREWLQKSYLGREALSEGWARPIFGLVWQIKRARDRDGKPCGFDDIKVDDLSLESMSGQQFVKYCRENMREANIELERKILLKESFM